MRHDDVNVRAVIRGGCDAQACRSSDELRAVAVAGRKPMNEHVRKFVRPFANGLHRTRVRDVHRKDVSADTTDELLANRALPQRVPDLDQQGIADHRTVRFVDLPKRMDVDQDDGIARIGAGRCSCLRSELRSVEQARQYVVRLLVRNAVELPTLLQVVGKKRCEHFHVRVLLRAEWPAGRQTGRKTQCPGPATGDECRHCERPRVVLMAARFGCVRTLFDVDPRARPAALGNDARDDARGQRNRAPDEVVRWRSDVSGRKDDRLQDHVGALHAPQRSPIVVVRLQRLCSLAEHGLPKVHISQAWIVDELPERFEALGMPSRAFFLVAQRCFQRGDLHVVRDARPENVEVAQVLRAERQQRAVR